MAARTRRQPMRGKVMLMNAREPHEVRVAVLVDKSLDEYYVERAAMGRLAGNIYKGLVANVDAVLQAAFVNIGLERNGFLHASDVTPPDGGFAGILGKPDVPKPRKRQRLPIQHMLRARQELLVQVSREGVGAKGPAVTTFISLPGRYLVLTPAMRLMGVSKKISDEAVRAQLRERLKTLAPPEDAGMILRTAAAAASDAELKNDLAALQALWEALKEKARTAPAPALIYEEQALATRALREMLALDTEEVIVDTEDAFRQAREFVRQVAPALLPRLKLHQEPAPLLAAYGVEEQVEALFERQVPLPSGGHIVIEQTEAMVTIDVNSGHSRERSSTEEMLLKTNLEAAREIARQLRLRDIGGLVLMDFIDMQRTESKKELQRTLREVFKKDRARFDIAPISRYGIVEMTRQRTGRGLRNVVYARCPHCAGSGFVRSGESTGLVALRAVQEALFQDAAAKTVRVRLNPADVAGFANDFRQPLAALETKTGSRIILEADAQVTAGRVKVAAEREGRQLLLLER